MSLQIPDRGIRLATARLVLRPTEPADADRAFEIHSDWGVARMLRMAAFPPDRSELRQWFSEHPDEWRKGRAYRFAMERDDRVIGVIDVDEIAEGEGDLGYWLEQSSWGKGFASEAARAIVSFAFEHAGIQRLLSGHAADNPASGSVLRSAGFQVIDELPAAYRSRSRDVLHVRYTLSRS